jgi:hypothetical protein
MAEYWKKSIFKQYKWNEYVSQTPSFFVSMVTIDQVSGIRDKCTNVKY